MEAYFQQLLEGKIDFEGQKYADQLSRVILIAATVVSFILGFALQSLSVALGTFGLATVFVALLVIPPWPMYNRYPVKWLDPVDNKKEE